MLLAIDIGNTNITTGLFQNGLLVTTRRAATNRAATPDELELLIEGLLGLDTLDLRGIAAIACASVVPSLTAAIESIAIRRDLALVLATAGHVPLPIRVERPDEVGADRLVNALAAARLYGTPSVVVIEFAPIEGAGPSPFAPRQLEFDTSGFVQMELLGLERDEA